MALAGSRGPASAPFWETKRVINRQGPRKETKDGISVRNRFGCESATSGKAGRLKR